MVAYEKGASFNLASGMIEIYVVWVIYKPSEISGSNELRAICFFFSRSKEREEAWWTIILSLEERKQ